MTNYEWLKSLDIQQLAKWLSDNAYDSDELPPEDYIVWLNNEYDGIETEPASEQAKQWQGFNLNPREFPRLAKQAVG